jgi:hypothetical protein
MRRAKALLVAFQGHRLRLSRRKQAGTAGVPRGGVWVAYLCTVEGCLSMQRRRWVHQLFSITQIVSEHIATFVDATIQHDARSGGAALPFKEAVSALAESIKRSRWGCLVG